MPESRYVRPDEALLTELAAQALRQAGISSEPANWEWVETGSSNVVILTDAAAVRLSRDSQAGVETVRAQRVVDALGPLPFGVPRSLGPWVEADGIVGIATQRLLGQSLPPGPADPAQLALLVNTIRSVELEPLRNDLAQTRAFAGGAGWYAIMTEGAIPLLPKPLQAAGQEVADALRELESGPVSLSHGDLAGSNILWEHGRVSGVLDWDLASAGDVAEDLASLGGWHGWDSLKCFATPEEMRRAEIFQASFPLQVLGFNLLHGRTGDELERAVARAGSRLRERAAR